MRGSFRSAAIPSRARPVRENVRLSQSERRALSADVTVEVARLDGGPRLIIEQAQLLAYDFFRLDDSSVGLKAYDHQVGKTDPSRITTDDIVAINTTMRARSPHSAWESLTADVEPLPWLAAIPTGASLFRMTDPVWRGLRPELEVALAFAIAPYRNLSVFTKVLHLKRPSLFPVLDSLVIQQIGGVGRPAIKLLDHLRSVGRTNLKALTTISAALTAVSILRTEVRILDALLWSSHPGAGLASKLGSWEHRVGVARAPATSIRDAGLVEPFNTGPVDLTRDHMTLAWTGSTDHGDTDALLVARVAQAPNEQFIVEMVLPPDDPAASIAFPAVFNELRYYLVELDEADPWGYAGYHCGTAANIYSSVHWSWFPHGIQAGGVPSADTR